MPIVQHVPQANIKQQIVVPEELLLIIEYAPAAQHAVSGSTSPLRAKQQDPQSTECARRALLAHTITPVEYASRVPTGSLGSTTPQQEYQLAHVPLPSAPTQLSASITQARQASWPLAWYPNASTRWAASTTQPWEIHPASAWWLPVQTPRYTSTTMGRAGTRLAPL